jgi:hypothetical protein
MSSFLYTRIGVLLLAIEVQTEERREIRINPSGRTLIQRDTMGFFVAQSADEVKRCVCEIKKLS